MSEHRVKIQWASGDKGFSVDSYSRDHTWTFECGIELNVSAAPAFQGNPDLVDPEEALVGAIASCHMLTFLALAAKKRLVVDRYEDEAVGFLETNEQDKLAVTRAVLRPKVVWGDGRTPDAEEMAKMHERAHQACIIANSVLTEIAIEPR